MQEKTLTKPRNSTSNIHSSEFGSVSYDIFGSPYQKTGSFLADDSLNFGYLGKPYNADTELYDYGFRDYSPEIARFTSIDPIRDGRNWYSYVVNDPVNYVDLWGLQCKSESDKIDAYYDWHSLNNQLNTYLKLSWELEDKIIKTEFEIEELEYKIKNLNYDVFMSDVVNFLDTISTFGNTIEGFIDGLTIYNGNVKYAVVNALLETDIQAVGEYVADMLSEAYDPKIELENAKKIYMEKTNENKENRILLKVYRDEIKKIKVEMYEN